ncbi:hypothetical protein Lepto7375DRAFT_2873 [Leptolyngbya sp. PCC 7375]|nr:hypothetical protein Lepto7375DRAFT_2873 [Leptolyngbya sp. PCC 7375]
MSETDESVLMAFLNGLLTSTVLDGLFKGTLQTVAQPYVIIHRLQIEFHGLISLS